MSIIVAFLLASAGTAADQPAVATPSETPAPAKAKEKKICKTDDADPGSHMIKRTCKTQAEWDQQGVMGSGRSGFSVSGEKAEGH